MRRRVFPSFALALGLTIGLSACSVAVPAIVPTPTPSSPPPVALASALVGSQLSTASSIRSVMFERGGQERFEGQWGYLDGDSSFNTAVDSVVLNFISSREPSGSPSFEPALGPNAIHEVTSLSAGAIPRLDTDIILATGSTLGVQITEADSPTTPGHVVTTLFTNFASDQTSDGAGLFSAAGYDALGALLGRVAGLHPPAVTPDLLRTASIDTTGRLVITVPSGGAAGGTTVSIRAAVARPLLSPFGRFVQAAAIADEPAAPAPAVPAGYRHVPCVLIACVALTYDDGPGVDTTQNILTTLKSEGASGTFFEIGSNVSAHPDLTSAVLDSGNVVGNHTWDHPNLTTLTSDEDRAEIDKTDAAIVATGHHAPTIMRAPYGATNDAVRQAVGKALIHWSVDSFDWKSRKASIFVPLVMRKIRPGGIVLMHDIYQTTAEGQKPLIEGLLTRGYTLVTVPQLFDGIPLQPGGLYACRGTYTPDTGVPCVSGP